MLWIYLFNWRVVRSFYCKYAVWSPSGWARRPDLRTAETVIFGCFVSGRASPRSPPFDFRLCSRRTCFYIYFLVESTRSAKKNTVSWSLDVRVPPRISRFSNKLDAVSCSRASNIYFHLQVLLLWWGIYCWGFFFLFVFLPLQSHEIPWWYYGETVPAKLLRIVFLCSFSHSREPFPVRLLIIPNLELKKKKEKAKPAVNKWHQKEKYDKS